MASSINASTTTGLVSTADLSGILNLQSNGTTIATVQSTGFSLPTASTINAANTFGFKNRIINGGMTIDQRNAGALTNPAVNATYYLDRWYAISGAASKYSIGQNAGAVTPPAGFINYLGCTSLSAYTVGASEQFVVRQAIEGLNIADLAWGTASAKTITISAQVRSSLTGTFGGSIYNNAGDRSYPFTYSISTANTWTSISVTIAGDTSGTWLTTNGVGIYVGFSIGAGATVSGTAGSWSSTLYRSATGGVSVVGTSGATFYITGVQFEVGSQATSFDFRSQGTELALCQRYYEISYTAGVKPSTVTNVGAVVTLSTPSGAATLGVYPVQVNFAISKRTTPTMTAYSTNSGASGNVYVTNPAADSANTPFLYTSSSGYSGYTAANIVNAGGLVVWQWAASAEI